jgi:molybdopterin-guanine dinucleotide biosynthesis protein A
VNGPLAVHGFVLAGGKSLRMGRDKALLEFRGRPMVEIAVEKLRRFCAEVSIVGEREDLSALAPVVRGERVDAGPAAGVEAGLRAATREWVMFVPVDAPLAPGELLRAWMTAVIEQGKAGCRASYLLVNQRRHPVFCALRRECLAAVAAALERGERRLDDVLASADGLWVCDADRFAAEANPAVLEKWFSNVNTPEELGEAELAP